MHAPPVPVQHLVTCGNTNAIDLVLRTLLNRGDVVLAEEFTYSATLQAMRPLGVSILGVPSDEEGPLPDALRAMLLRARPRSLHLAAFACICAIDTP
jgi:DNA-binding transcriptional MocR family regulator